MATANDLLDRAIEETKYLHTNEIFLLVSNAFQRYEHSLRTKFPTTIYHFLIFGSIHSP